MCWLRDPFRRPRSVQFASVVCLYIKNRDLASPVAAVFRPFLVLFASGPCRQSVGAGESACAAGASVRGRVWSSSVRFRTLVSRWSALRLVLWFCGSVGGSVVACRGSPHGSPGCVRRLSSRLAEGFCCGMLGCSRVLIWAGWLAWLGLVGSPRLASGWSGRSGPGGHFSAVGHGALQEILGAGLAVFQLGARQRSYLL